MRARVHTFKQTEKEKRDTGTGKHTETQRQTDGKRTENGPLAKFAAKYMNGVNIFIDNNFKAYFIKRNIHSYM